MNSTFEMLMDISGKKETKALYHKIGKVLNGHDGGTILAILVQLIIEIHICSHVDDNETLFTKQSAENLTELLQSIRKIYDSSIVEIAKTDDSQ